MDDEKRFEFVDISRNTTNSYTYNCHGTLTIEDSCFLENDG